VTIYASQATIIHALVEPLVIRPAQCRAARGLLGWNQRILQAARVCAAQVRPYNHDHLAEPHTSGFAARPKPPPDWGRTSAASISKRHGQRGLPQLHYDRDGHYYGPNAQVTWQEAMPLDRHAQNVCRSLQERDIVLGKLPLGTASLPLGWSCSCGRNIAARLSRDKPRPVISPRWPRIPPLSRTR
jgi:hypothetical protein